MDGVANRASHLLEVARCPIVERCLEAAEPAHPCAKVVLTQWDGVPAGERIATWRSRHQLPEPWRGRIELAPILFVSSNPSISRHHGALQPDRKDDPRVVEHPSLRRAGHPKWDWQDEEIADHYQASFDLHVADNTRNVLPDGTLTHPTPFWVAVQEYAQTLLPGRQVRAGVDYVLTEAVRCKSKGEGGVGPALSTCAGRYLEETLRQAAATVVLALGSQAARAFESVFAIARTRAVTQATLGDRPRLLAFLPHPTAYIPAAEKTLSGALDSDAVEQLRQAASAHVPEMPAPPRPPFRSQAADTPATAPRRAAAKRTPGVSTGRTVAERYAPKHARARQAVNLDPKATSETPPYPVGTRVRGVAGLLRNHDGVVTRSSWSILPHGQMVVHFDDPVVGPYKYIAALPEDVRPLS